jgi:hypothetical protein
MLDALPYADLLAIHNVLAEKSVRRFDTRTNGEKRTLALMEARGLTAEEAARLAGVVLGDGEGEGGEAPDEEPDEPVSEEPIASPEPDDEDRETTITVASDIAPMVKAFMAELAKPERPTYVATVLRRLTGETARPAAPRERQMTASQRTIAELCGRPQGATGKELAEGCGWPTIAARATCQKITTRFGYSVRETPRTNERGISFHMTRKASAEG